MTNRDATKERGGGEALRKHREKRRAQAVRKPEQQESQTPRERSRRSSLGEAPNNVIVSLEHKRNKQEVIKTIVATEQDRERMRKISKLGLDHPADRPNHKSTGSGSRKILDVAEDMVITTCDAGDVMRKISILGFEDPADVAHDGTRRNRERRLTNGVGPRSSNARVVSGDSERSNSNRQPERGQVQRSKSEDAGSFVVPFVVALPESTGDQQRGRTHTVGVSGPDCGDGHLTVRKEKQVRSKSLDFELNFGDVNDESDFVPMQVAIPQHDSRENGPKAFGGVIEPTQEQQELMRKVSALGMQDPVFRNVHKDKESRLSNTIEEEHDLKSPKFNKENELVPESPATQVTSAMTGSTKSDRESSEDMGVYVPPVGSFVRRVSRATADVSAPAQSPSPPHGKQIRKSARGLRTGPGRSKRGSSETRGTNNVSDTESYSFIPPTGSFNRKKSAKPPVSRDALMKDIELAKEAQSMFAQDSLLGASASNLGQSISNLNQSLSELNFNESSSSLHDSWVSDSQRIASNRSSQPSSVHSSKPPAPHEPYLPPLSPTQMMSKERVRSSSSSRNTRPPPGNKPNALSKTNSIRSWEGDVQVDDPMAVTTATSNPLWSSLSQLDTSFLSKKGQAAPY